MDNLYYFKYLLFISRPSGARTPIAGSKRGNACRSQVMCKFFCSKQSSNGQNVCTKTCSCLGALVLYIYYISKWCHGDRSN
jgi:hypothetical protein